VTPALLAVLLVLNVVSFALFALDKRHARRGEERISERALLVSALVSGTIGAWLAMWLLHHKRRKLSFVAAMLLVTAVDVGIVLAFVS
jgi:uncharacterized membrane protein YsdA (DUF1294 family)